MYRTYLLDFDDTLAVGPMTWAIETALPALIARHGLAADGDQLARALLRAQELAATQFDESRLIENFLADMGWADELRADLAAMAGADFQFTPFADTVPFLAGLRERDIRVIVISNNNRCPGIAAALGIDGYIEAFITPKLWGGLARKPHRAMFDQAASLVSGLGPENTVVLGDDPWSDAAFAAACGLPCWIIDRTNRYAGIAMMSHVTRIVQLGQALF